jgi:hypothetical protein
MEEMEKHDFVVARGRNNRKYVRKVNKLLFNEKFWWAHEQEIFFNNKDAPN